MKIDSRGVRCLECTHLDMKTHPERAKAGFGLCAAWNPVIFVSINMSRNCTEFDTLPADVIEARDTWAADLAMFWQRNSSRK